MNVPVILYVGGKFPYLVKEADAKGYSGLFATYKLADEARKYLIHLR